jgi:PKD repeat protein
MILRASGRAWAPNVRSAWLALCLGLLAACDKVPLTAPTESTITLFANGSSLASNGSLDITATVTESAGTAVQNGTVVTFTTTLGTITPSEARTNNGKVTVKLSANGRSGTASVVAFSGSATSDALEIPVGGAAAETIVLDASSSTVPASGGTVTLTATVSDGSGNGLANVPVTFSTTAGTLSQTSVPTNANGQATTSLTTSRNATVTARAGGQETTTDITVSDAPTVEVIVSPDQPVAGSPTTFIINVTASDSGERVQSMTIDFGDGDSQTLGTTSTSVAHVYDDDGTYTVRVRVRDTSGQETTQVLVIAVTAPAAIPVTISVTPTTPKAGSPVSFTAEANAGTSTIESYAWNFGDGKSATTTGPSTSHIYSTAKAYVVAVKVTAADGAKGEGQTSITVEP